MKRIHPIKSALMCAALSVAVASTASAQPADQPADPYADENDKKPDEGKPEQPPPDKPDDRAWPEPAGEPERSNDPAAPRAPELGDSAGDAGITKIAEPKPERIRDEPPLLSPRAFNAQTARLLPAAVIYNSSGIDTSGGISSDLRVGLGDVAEFGLALNDQVRARPDGEQEFDRVYPYFVAMFKLGIAEHRIFKHQPALAIAFRKSFERDDGGFKSRTAGLEVVASKSLGDKVQIHVGGVLWDAQLEAPGMDPVFLHGRDFAKAARPFGAIEIEALDNASIMVEWVYNPHFIYAAAPTEDNIGLTEQLAWGVRYQISKAVALESGVRVNEITEANLIDAQIFGQLTWASYKVRNWINRLK